MKDSTELFSDRANEYAIYRPKYPPACIDFLCNQFHLNNDSVVADIGSGTGILSQLLLEKGCAVVGVEPNADMRRMAEHQITSEKFISVNGTAESTHLRDGSVDLITVAQAFHWVDPFRAKKEFKRILRNGRAIAIMWNVQTKETSFAKRYEQIKEKYGKDYIAIRKSHEPDLTAFFKPLKYAVKKFPHHIILDQQGLSGLIQSSSFMPRPADRLFASMINEINTVFAEHNENGLVKINYDTHVHYGE